MERQRALSRRKGYRWRAAVLAALVVSCRVASPEERTLLEFFRLARIGDHVTLATIATVTLDPRSEGTVRTFSIIGVQPPQRAPLDADTNGLAFVVASLTPPGQPDVDPSRRTIASDREEVTVAASLRRPDGRVVPTTFSITMQRAADLTSGEAREGRWIVTAIRRMTTVPAHAE